MPIKIYLLKKSCCRRFPFLTNELFCHFLDLIFKIKTKIFFKIFMYTLFLFFCIPVQLENKLTYSPIYLFFLAKGRTNVELREQFTLAPGVSQSMTSFKPKTSQQQKVESPNSSVSGQGSRNPSTSGPITKVNKQTKLSFFQGKSKQTSD